MPALLRRDDGCAVIAAEAVLPDAPYHLDGVDAFPGGYSTPPPWHIDAVGGAFSMAAGAVKT